MCNPLSSLTTASSVSPWSETSILFFCVMSSQSDLTRSTIESDPHTASSAASSSFTSAACFTIAQRATAARTQATELPCLRGDLLLTWQLARQM